MKKTAILAAVLAAVVAGCGASGAPYVEEANNTCAASGGIISYSYGESYDVVVCKDGVAHEIPGS